jgi:DNA-binding NtrC family response regulator
MSQVRHVSDPDRLEPVLQQAGPSVLIVDLRSKECRELIDQIQNEQPDVLIIAFGVAQSETLREAEQFGIYAAEEIGLERRRFQAVRLLESFTGKPRFARNIDTSAGSFPQK